MRSSAGASVSRHSSVALTVPLSCMYRGPLNWGLGSLTGAARASIAQASRIARAIASLLIATPVHALQDDCVSNPDSGPCQQPPIIVEGEDPCDDNLGSWSEAWGDCRCYNGYAWEDQCQPPGWDDEGGGDDGGDDPGGGSGTSPAYSYDGSDLEPMAPTCPPQPPRDSTTQNMQNYEVYKAYCNGSPPDSAQTQKVLATLTYLDQKNPTCAAHTQTMRNVLQSGKLRIFTNSGQQFGGAAAKSGDWMLLEDTRFSTPNGTAPNLPSVIVHGVDHILGHTGSNTDSKGHVTNDPYNTVHSAGCA